MQEDGCLMVLQDQSLRQAAEQEVKRLAFYDALTDLPNRRLMADRLQQALETCLRRQHFGGVVLLDIDNFKAFNEDFGLELGDLLLVGMSQRIKAQLPAGRPWRARAAMILCCCWRIWAKTLWPPRPGWSMRPMSG